MVDWSAMVVTYFLSSLNTPVTREKLTPDRLDGPENAAKLCAYHQNGSDPKSDKSSSTQEVRKGHMAIWAYGGYIVLYLVPCAFVFDSGNETLRWVLDVSWKPFDTHPTFGSATMV